MKKGLGEKRIPTVVALVLVFISIWVTSFLIQGRTLTVGLASGEIVPQNVKIANVSDTAFTVIFTTKKDTVAGIKIEASGNLESVVYDVRNTNKDKQTPYYSHFITADNLNPKTTYSFSIISGGKVFLDSNSKKYRVTTGPTLSTERSETKTFSGKILLPDGTPAADTVVYIFVNRARIIATLTKDSGEYSLPAVTRTTTLDNYFPFEENTDITITAARGSLSSRVKLRYKDSDTTPTITLQQDYNFSVDTHETAIAKPPQLFIPSPQASGQISVLAPREHEFFIDNQPVFSGTAVSASTVKITLPGSVPSTTEVVAGRGGTWSFRPSTPLAPGAQTLTVETKDSFGVTKRITRNFNIFSSGSQVFQTATPSATPTISISPSLPTPTIQVVFSPTPTLADSVSPTPTLPPNLGTTSVSLLVTFTAFIFIVTGALLLFVAA